MYEPWWNPHEVEIGQTALWRVGPLTLYALRRHDEWLIGYTRDDTLPDDISSSFALTGASIPPEADIERFVFSQTHPKIQLSPLLASRPVVTRPVSTLSIPPKEKITFYAGSPVWLKVEVGEPGIQLKTLAVYRPSDSWFGPDTIDGELCYAARTAARLHIEEMPFRPWRAVTPLTVTNLGGKTLTLDRIKVPVHNLPLFASEEGLLWTPTVRIERKKEEASVALTLDEEAPPEVNATVPVASPRKTPSHAGGVMKAFTSLFG